jgi:uncharacterized protein YjgD (DUF1641 family)
VNFYESKKDVNPSGVTLELDKPTLEALVDLLNTVKFLQNYLNDQVINDISKILCPILKLVNAISNTDLVDVLERALQEPSLDKALLNPPKIGLMGLLSALREEEVQRGMGIVIELLRALGKASKTT